MIVHDGIWRIPHLNCETFGGSVCGRLGRDRAGAGAGDIHDSGERYYSGKNHFFRYFRNFLDMFCGLFYL
jgi:hypothetical protein